MEEEIEALVAFGAKMNIDQLLEFDRLAKIDGQEYPKQRPLYDQISQEQGSHFVGIVGPRGSGKTILLKQLAVSYSKSFYISLDTIEGSLFDIVKTLVASLEIELFLLDEVHAYPLFDADLKKIYDILHVRVYFTSSTALAMYQSGYDLSRRVVLKELYPFSLREYAWFKHEKNFPGLTFSDMVAGSFSLELLRAEEFFLPYIQGGLMPFALRDPQPLTILGNILKTIIYKDIPRIGNLLTNELEKIYQLVRFVGLSGIDGINYSAISRNIHVTKYKAEQYVSLLERAFVLHRVFPLGSNVLKEPKIVMSVPFRLLFRPLNEAIGGLREDFFVEALKALGKDLFYLKSVRGGKTPDYCMRDLEDIVFEIGGKNKGRSQFKGIEIKTKIILTDSLSTEGIRRPLFLVGLIDH